MVNERERASELANIITKRKTHYEDVEENAGYGDRFSQYAWTTVTKSYTTFAHPDKERGRARRELKRIVNNTEDEGLRNEYADAAKLEIDWGNAIVGGLFYSGSLGLAGFLIYKWLQ